MVFKIICKDPELVPMAINLAIEDGEKELAGIIGRMPQRCRQGAESLRQREVAQIRSQVKLLREQNLASAVLIDKMDRLITDSFKRLEGTLGKFAEKCIVYGNQKESAQRDWDILEQADSSLDGLLEFPAPSEDPGFLT